MELVSILLVISLLSFLVMFGISIYEWICYISWRKSIFSITIFKKKISNIPVRKLRKFDIRSLRLDLENDTINKNHTKFVLKFLGEKSIIFRKPYLFLQRGVPIEPYGIITIDKDKKEIEISQKVWLTVFYVLLFWIVFGIIIMVTVSPFGILLIVVVVIFICSLLYQYYKKLWVYKFLQDRFEK